MKYYLGIDNGGTTTKAGLFSLDGREMGMASVATASVTPKPDYIERNMEEMWEANCRVIHDVLEKTGIAPACIAGVGICGHGKGLYLWGKDNRPVRNGIASTDNRAYAYPLEWKRAGIEEQVFPITCQHILASQPVSLLAWIRDHEPENFRNIKWVFVCKDYIRFRLTGNAHAELTDYSGTNLVNLHTGKYDDELLTLFGLESIRQALPPLCRSTDLCGCVTKEAASQCGLVAGTPVAAGMFDIDACALATGVTDEDYFCMIAGTWSINEYLRKTPVMDMTVRMNSIFCNPEYYLVEESSPTSSGNNEWYINQILPEVKGAAGLLGCNVYEIMNQWVESITPQEFIPVFLPFLMGSNVHPNAKGAFIGVNISHTRKHLLRSIYEGIVFSHRYHMEKLMKSRESVPHGIRLAGGAAKSAVWTQMFADVLQLPIETVETEETGALGSAIAAAVAVGAYKTYKDAIHQMCRVSSVTMPHKELRYIYDQRYKLYCQIIRCLDGMWDTMQTTVED